MSGAKYSYSRTSYSSSSRYQSKNIGLDDIVAGGVYAVIGAAGLTIYAGFKGSAYIIEKFKDAAIYYELKKLI